MTILAIRNMPLIVPAEQIERGVASSWLDARQAQLRDLQNPKCSLVSELLHLFSGRQNPCGAFRFTSVLGS